VKSILTAFPSPTISDFTLGAVTIHFYALFIILGIAVAATLSALRMQKRGANSGIAIDIAIWAVPFGIVGGRIFHVLTHWSDYFGAGKNPASALYVWEGGLAIYGALIFGAVGVYFGTRMSGIKFMAYADILVPGLILAQGIGRWGNYFNQELFGTPTDLPWGLNIANAANNPAWPVGLPFDTLMQPMFLYESIWDIAGVAVLLFLEKKFRLQWGRLFGAYLMYYAVGRGLIEPFRLDAASTFLGIRVNEWMSIVMFVVGAAIVYVQKRNHTGIETSIFLPGHEPVVETEAEAAEGIAEAIADAPAAETEADATAKKPAKKRAKAHKDDVDFSADEVNSKSE